MAVSPSYQINNRSLDSLITGLQSLQQCKFLALSVRVCKSVLVPVSEGDYTAVAEDTDIPLDGSASFLHRESETNFHETTNYQHDMASEYSSHNSSTIFLP